MKNTKLSAFIAAVIVILSAALGGCGATGSTSQSESSSQSQGGTLTVTDGTEPPETSDYTSSGAVTSSSGSSVNSEYTSDNSEHTSQSNPENTSQSTTEHIPSQITDTTTTPITDRTDIDTATTAATTTEKPTEITTTEKPAEITTTEKPAEITTTEKPAEITTTQKPTEITTTEKPPETAAPKPSEPYIITPTAGGKNVYENDKALIDASNSSQGYLMVRLKSAQQGTYKIVVEAKSASAKYTFRLSSDGSYEVIPFTEGSGKYMVYVLEQIAAGKGAVVLKQEIDVSISDPFRPFLTPNQYCMYDANSDCVALASKLCGGKNELEKVGAIYDYVIKNIDYVSTAENAANGYVPYPDRTLANKSGICFDYSSLITAMLRSQKIPTKVVVGYAGDIYHAWISVYVEGSGWIDGIISFDGKKWNRMDPTFAAGAGSDAAYIQMIEYISDSSNYSDMYYY